MLELNLIFHWYNEIREYRKLEEYRTIKDHYVSRLFDWKKSVVSREYFTNDLLIYGMKSNFWKYKKDIKYIKFANGYRTDRPWFIIPVKKFRIGYPKKKWGGNPSKKCFIFDLGDIV